MGSSEELGNRKQRVLSWRDTNGLLFVMLVLAASFVSSGFSETKYRVKAAEAEAKLSGAAAKPIKSAHCPRATDIHPAEAS